VGEQFLTVRIVLRKNPTTMPTGIIAPNQIASRVRSI